MKKVRIICLLTFLFINVAQAQQAGLDPSFGDKGIALDKYTGKFKIATDVAIQPDGKIIVSGDFIARYKTNGQPDSSFGGIGILRFDTLLNPLTGFGYSMHLLNSGKLLVSGTGSGGRFLLCIRPDGKADSTFGTSGVTYYTGGAGNIALQPDGKILVAGQGGGLDDRNSYVHRLLANGRFDSTFGTNGTVKNFTGAYGGFVNCVGVLSDGRITIAGLGYDTMKNRAVFLCRYWPDGRPDLSLNNSGIIFPIITSYSNRSCILSDGRVLLHVGGVSSGDAVARLKADGSLDSSFGEDGFREVPGVTISTILLLADGKILCGGYTPEDWAVARINKDGASIDRSFGKSGVVTTDIRGFRNDRIARLAVQPDGKIIAAGQGRINADNDPRVALARYLPDASVAVPASPAAGRANTAFIIPNPGTDRMLVKGIDNTEIKRLETFSAEGKCLAIIDNPKTLEIHVKEYPDGMYLMRITGKQNQHINLRFMVVH